MDIGGRREKVAQLPKAAQAGQWTPSPRSAQLGVASGTAGQYR